MFFKLVSHERTGREEETESFLKRVKKGSEMVLLRMRQEHDRVGINPVMLIDCGKKRDS